jgi:hypothetical protein
MYGSQFGADLIDERNRKNATQEKKREESKKIIYFKNGKEIFLA